MKWSVAIVFLGVTGIAPIAAAQMGGYGGGGRGMMESGRYAPQAPKLPGVELTGPLDTALARTLLELSDVQATRYAQSYDSFMVATQPQRDSATAALAKMNEKLDEGDRSAALFYVEQVQDLGKGLKTRQDRFESDLRHFLSGDQMKEYKKWRDGEDQAAEQRRRADSVRWAEASFRGQFGGMGARASAPEFKTALAAPAAIAPPDLGAAAVRVGRALYITGQLGVDSLGALVGSDLHAQAVRAFANLATMLQAAGATPRDVTALTIYVVNYKPADLATLREAGATFLGPNPPIVTVLGTQSLARDGALVSVSATAWGGRP